MRESIQEQNDVIVYQLVSNGGGIDGLDFEDKGGNVTHVFYTRIEAEQHSNKPWCSIRPVVIDLKEVKRQAKAKLSVLDKLVLNIK